MHKVTHTHTHKHTGGVGERGGREEERDKGGGWFAGGRRVGGDLGEWEDGKRERVGGLDLACLVTLLPCCFLLCRMATGGATVVL